jgi:predicted acylesterase/phospholipase RssA
LWVIRRGENHTTRIEQIPIGLATVPMAVAASSAFPGFFPPIMLTGADVGARGGEYGRKAYTDGGVFDNLGVRMFRCLAHASPDGRLPWDGVLVSDAGRPFEVQSKVRAAGIIRTAMRASDILMDRVWQLETETFRDTPGFAFARITNIVDPEEDPTALHPEVQRQLSGIRTDLDRFSDLEISSLVRHGYCVGGKTCRARPDLFGKEVLAEPVAATADEQRPASSSPADLVEQTLLEREPASVTVTSGALPPSPLHRLRTLLQSARDWIESALASGAAKRLGSFLPRHQPTEATRTARTLNAASARRVWTTLLDHRDWTSYVYVPLIVPLLFLTPYFVIKAYERSHRINQIYESLAQESRDLEQMTRLIDGPVPPFTGERAQALPLDKLPDPKDFTILQDLRIVDLRRWNPASGFGSSVYGYRRLKVRKEPNNQSNAFRISVLAISPDTQVRFPPQQLKPELYSRSLTTHGRPEQLRHWEVGADLTSVPPGEPVDIIYEHFSPGLFLKSGIEATTLAFDVEMETIELSRWLLLPQDREHGGYQLVRHPSDRPTAVEIVKPVTEFRADDRTILAFKLLALKPGYTYELTWFYR